jgi:hypothetical protein
MEAYIRFARVLFDMYPISNVNLRPIVRGLKLHYFGRQQVLQFLPLIEKDSAYVLLKNIKDRRTHFLEEFADQVIDPY